LLRIRITAEVNGVRNEYMITFGRYRKDNAIVGYAYARADAPGGRETDVERFSALIKALTGKEPWITRIKNGQIMIECMQKRSPRRLRPLCRTRRRHREVARRD
jgi:hypothetical protein